MLSRIRPFLHLRLNGQIRRLISHTTVAHNAQTSQHDFSIDDIISKIGDVTPPAESLIRTNKDIQKINITLHRLNSFPVNMSSRDFSESSTCQEIKNLLEYMEGNEIITVLNTLALRKFRDIDLITPLSERLIRLREDLTPHEITTLALAIRQLSFHSPRLTKYMVNNFVNQAKNFNNWLQISAIAYSFAAVKVNSPKFWISLSEVMNANLNKASINLRQLQRTVASCAIVNVPTHLIEKPIAIVVEDLKQNAGVRTSSGEHLNSSHSFDDDSKYLPRIKASPVQYLNVLHGLAILKSLSNYEANKILQPEFFEDLQKQYNRKTIVPSQLPKEFLMRLIIRILQVASCVRYDLKIEPNLPSKILALAEENKSHVEKIRHGSSLLTTIPEFHQNFYITAPLETHSIAPHLDISTGSYIDAIVYVCPKRRIILPLSEGENSPDAEKTAVLFVSYGLSTTMDAGALDEAGYPLSRPLGELKMNVRHLLAKGFKPALIDYFTLTSLQTNAQKIMFIKEEIVKPYEDLFKDWH